ncbi:TPR-like protein [Xylariaceae sp. FL0255]|nr:TPR-like protein [Xylariaceae sp. FL0255]
MHIREISDEVAERLKLEQSQKTESKSEDSANSSSTVPDISQNGPAITSAPTVGPELSPGRSEKKSVEEVVAELKRTPFFMTELEENDETEAFKALAYEGTPLENGTDFKERGNECFKAKKWSDAKEFYTKGIVIIAAEEKARENAAETAPSSSLTPTAQKSEPTPQSQHKDGDTSELSPEEEIAQQRAVLESLYVNRAACHLELKNYRSAWLDGSAALRLNPKNVKAYYRSARAFLAVGRLAEADDACAAGLELDESNNALRAVARDIIAKVQVADAKNKKEAVQQAQEKRRAQLIKAALMARGIRTRMTAQPPEMEDAGIKLVPDPDDPASALSFPVVLLYPLHYESDFIKAVVETQSLGEHLAYVFPLPWDNEGAYRSASVELYVETVGGGMLKVGKKAPLLKVLSGGRVEVVDEVLKVFALPSAKAAEWVSDFKMKRAAEKGAR